MARKVSHCEYCGDDLGREVEKDRDDVIVCGKRECCRYEQDVYRERDADARERAEADDYGAYR